MIVFIFIILAGLLTFQTKLNKSLPFSKHEFYAVFLDNQQMYVGEIVKSTPNTIFLKNIYYLQTSDVIDQNLQSSSLSAQISLIKLGDELHQPKDEMIIQTQHILFYQPLKAEGPVYEALKASSQSENK